MAFALTITFLYGDVHDKPRWSTGSHSYYEKHKSPLGLKHGQYRGGRIALLTT